MSRPSKYKNTECTVVRKLTEAFRNDFTIQEACSYAGIAKDTYYRWLKENEEFSDEIGRSKMFVLIQAKKVIAKSIAEGSIKASKWFLERRDPRYSKRQPAVDTQIEPLTPKEVEEIEKTLKIAGLK